MVGLLWGAATVQAGKPIIVPAGTDPGELGLSGSSLQRVKDALKELPDGHAVEVVFAVSSRAVTGYDEDMRYVSRTTVLDAEGKTDGEERNFANWHQPRYRTATYRGGVQHGIERRYDPTGSPLLAEIPWEEGEIHGIRRTFHPDGAVQTETPYTRGVIEGGSRTFDQEGRVLRLTTFRKGQRHGEVIDRWPSNPEQVQRIVPYREGQVHGTAKSFYLDGALQWERPFVENRQHGIERHFEGDGTFRREIFWFEGAEVTRAEWESRTGAADGRGKAAP